MRFLANSNARCHRNKFARAVCRLARQPSFSTQFDAPTPEALIHRYNLSQAQGVLYRASHVTITAHRNDPGEYKLLFRYMKLFGLMAYIEGRRRSRLYPDH